MLFSALRTSLAIVFLRAGPQDMPFDNTPRLLRETLLFTLACYAAFWMVQFSVLAAIMASLLVIMAQWLSVRAILATRNLQNRFQQTLMALLLSNALLTLPMIPFFAMLAPSLREWFDQLQQHPELMDHPEKLPLPPPGPTLVFYLLGLWQFVISVRIFGGAMEVGVMVAILIAMVAGIATSLFVTFMSPLISFMGS